MEENESREIRTYKIKNTPYKKAKDRANKEGKPLSTLVESWIINYSNGYNMKIIFNIKKRK